MAGASLADVGNRAIREMLGTNCVSRSLVNLQNGTATFDSVTEPDAIIRGNVGGAAMTMADVTNKVLATLDALQTPNTGQAGYYAQPISTTVYYLWVANYAGTSYVIQGTYSGQVIPRNGGQNSTRGDGSIPFIAVPDTYFPIAVFKVVNGVTAVFTPTSTFWDATNVTSSAAPVSVLPSSAAALTFVAGGA